jgi:hypothetical protein
MRMLGPSNDGISFTNIDGADDSEHALNTNARKSKKDWLNECTGVKSKKPEKEAEATLVTMAGVATEEHEEVDHVHFQFLMTGLYAGYRSVVLNQPSRAVSKAWILLNNQSTVNVFYNKDLLRNVRKLNTHMDIHCNAGVMSTKLIGDLYLDTVRCGITPTGFPTSSSWPGSRRNT